jgi:putative ABC transport system permease protein
VTVIWNDARHVVRSWRKAPSPAILAIATIACGIGALTVVSALVSAVLLKPLPYPDADRLVVLVNTLRGNTVRLPYVSPPRVRA